MVDRQEWMDQLLTYLQSTPPLPDYVGAEPTTAEAFDPYQMVSEWIALRQEMKQQGKLLQAAQEQGQRELERTRSHNETLQQQLADCQQQAALQDATALAHQEKRFEKEQERVWRGLLNVLDALDRACAFWDGQANTPSSPAPVVANPTFLTRIGHWLLSFDSSTAQPASAEATTALAASQSSDRQGVELIRQNLLDQLKQQQVVPMLSLGQPFDSQRMYAIGRQASDAPPNTVIQEVTRGYLWRDRVLREAQVIVSSGHHP